MKCCKTLLIKVIQGDGRILDTIVSELDKHNQSGSTSKLALTDSAEQAYLNQGGYQQVIP